MLKKYSLLALLSGLSLFNQASPMHGGHGVEKDGVSDDDEVVQQREGDRRVQWNHEFELLIHRLIAEVNPETYLPETHIVPSMNVMLSRHVSAITKKAERQISSGHTSPEVFFRELQNEQDAQIDRLIGFLDTELGVAREEFLLLKQAEVELQTFQDNNAFLKTALSLPEGERSQAQKLIVDRLRDLAYRLEHLDMHCKKTIHQLSRTICGFVISWAIHRANVFASICYGQVFDFYTANSAIFSALIERLQSDPSINPDTIELPAAIAQELPLEAVRERKQQIIDRCPANPFVRGCLERILDKPSTLVPGEVAPSQELFESLRRFVFPCVLQTIFTRS